MQANIEINVKREIWQEATINANNLCELQLALGDVMAAVASGQQGADYADQSKDMFQRMARRTTYADALYQAGETARAL